jgi:hypothetical protein
LELPHHPHLSKPVSQLRTAWLSSNPVPRLIIPLLHNVLSVSPSTPLIRPLWRSGNDFAHPFFSFFLWGGGGRAKRNKTVRVHLLVHHPEVGKRREEGREMPLIRRGGKWTTPGQHVGYRCLLRICFTCYLDISWEILQFPVFCLWENCSMVDVEAGSIPAGKWKIHTGFFALFCPV